MQIRQPCRTLELLGETGDEAHRVLEALDLGEVPRLGDELEARAGDALREEASVVDVDDTIGFAPGEQGGRRHSSETRAEAGIVRELFAAVDAQRLLVSGHRREGRWIGRNDRELAGIVRSGPGSMPTELSSAMPAMRGDLRKPISAAIHPPTELPTTTTFFRSSRSSVAR